MADLLNRGSKGCVFLNQHSLSPEGRWYMIQVFASLPKVTRSATWATRVFQYDANNYLVVSVTMPFECETFASPEEPLLGLYIDVDMGQLHDLIGRLGLQAEIGNASENGLPRGIGPAVMDEDMADATNRLIKCLQSETESQILGPGLVREILYRALCGPRHRYSIHWRCIAALFPRWPVH